MQKRYILLITLVSILVSYKACPGYFTNPFALLTEGNYFIPKESNMRSFQRTVSAEGSGDGWLYGEDNKYYFGMDVDDESDPCVVYYILRKGQESQDFNKFDTKTWGNRLGVRWMPEKLKSNSYKKECDK